MIQFYMRKVLLAFALLAWITSVWNPALGQSPSGVIAHPRTSQQHSNATATKPITYQMGTKARPLVVDTDGHVKTPAEAAAAEKEADRTRDVERRTLNAAERSARYADSMAWATWVLVLVGILGTISAVCTLIAIKRQTDAYIDSERAWVFCDIDQIPEDQIPIDPAKVEVLWLFPKIKNHGKTTALIMRVAVKTIIIPALERLPLNPEYGTNERLNLILAPKSNLGLHGVAFSAEDFAKARDGQSLYVYGLIEYTDIGKNIRRSGFCYLYYIQSGFSPHRTGFYPAALDVPSAYTECT